jgi:hypothetical protein
MEYCVANIPFPDMGFHLLSLAREGARVRVIFVGIWSGFAGAKWR